jgi:hypothetical protein
MPEQIANPLTEARETGRLEASSDGVFAIAITLLVLELKVPNLPTAGSSPAALGKALLQQWPSYVGLVTSFFTILIMWVHHHAILRNVCRTDAWLHFANGCLLLGVTFVPYPRRFWRPICERQRQKWLPCLFRHIRVHRRVLLSVYPRRVPQAAAVIDGFDGICCQDAPRLHVWSSLVPGCDTVSAFGRARVASCLHSLVDFLGENNYEEHAGLKAAFLCTLVIGGNELAVFDVHLTDVGRQPQLFTILG